MLILALLWQERTRAEVLVLERLVTLRVLGNDGVRDALLHHHIGEAHALVDFLSGNLILEDFLLVEELLVHLIH